MDFDYEELFRWIDELPITRQKKNLARDFSDADPFLFVLKSVISKISIILGTYNYLVLIFLVPMAEILKHYYPKVVDLHNYTPRNSCSQKLVNWQTLNKKVLSKLKMTLTTEIMDQISKAVPGVVDKVLWDVKLKVEAKAEGDKKDSLNLISFENISNSCDGIFPIKVKSGSKILEQKVVPTEIFEKMQKDITEKDEIIKSLETKIEHLEGIVNIKNSRIEDLTSQIKTMVDECNNNNNPNTSNPPKNGIFERFFFSS